MKIHQFELWFAYGGWFFASIHIIRVGIMVSDIPITALGALMAAASVIRMVRLAVLAINAQIAVSREP